MELCGNGLCGLEWPRSNPTHVTGRSRKFPNHGFPHEKKKAEFAMNVPLK